MKTENLEEENIPYIEVEEIPGTSRLEIGTNSITIEEFKEKANKLFNKQYYNRYGEKDNDSH